MKKLILLVAVVFTMTSCGAGFDKDKCRASVIKQFPNSKIYLIPDKDYTFIVVDSTGKTKIAKTMNWGNTDVTEVYELIEIKN